MPRSKKGRPPADIEIFLKHTGSKRGQSLQRTLLKELPRSGIRVRRYPPRRRLKRRAYVGKAKMIGGPWAAVQAIHEIYIIVCAHQYLVGAVGANALDKIMKATLKEVTNWQKRRREERARVVLFGPNGDPITSGEIRDGQIYKLPKSFLARARGRARTLIRSLNRK